MVNTVDTTDEPKTAQLIITITPTEKGYELATKMEGSRFPFGLGQAFFMKSVLNALTEEAQMMLSPAGSALFKSTKNLTEEINQDIKNGQPSGETKDCPEEVNGQDDN